MSWNCKSCGHKLGGKEKFCPECAAKVVYECKQCGKVLDDGKHKYCPICNTDKSEKRKEGTKKVLGAVGTVATTAVSFAAFVITKGKIGGGKA